MNSSLSSCYSVNIIHLKSWLYDGCVSLFLRLCDFYNDIHNFEVRLFYFYGKRDILLLTLGFPLNFNDIGKKSSLSSLMTVCAKCAARRSHAIISHALCVDPWGFRASSVTCHFFSFAIFSFIDLPRSYTVRLFVRLRDCQGNESRKKRGNLSRRACKWKRIV